MLRERNRRRWIAHEADLQSRDLAAFVKAAWSILEPVTPLSWNWHHDLICEYLTLIKEGRFKEVCGQQKEGIIFNVPPRTMKTLLISVFFPCWIWTCNPAWRGMFASYSDDLSTDHSVFRRTVIDSPWYQERWGHKFTFSKDQNLKTHYRNSSQGAMFATSMGSTATGKGGDDLIFDDPLNPKQAVSDIERPGVNTAFDTTFRSRRNDLKKGVIILVMQRLHENDLTGHILSKEASGWLHLKLPAVAEVKERWVFPISGRVVERQPGELLWPERLPEQQIENLKIGLGSWAFAGQYQQNPAPLEGGIVKRNWIRYYRELPEKFDLMVQSWDCTFKGQKAAKSQDIDFVAGQVWGKLPGRLLMLPYMFNERVDFGPTKAAIKSCHAKFPQAHAILIEDKANGPAIISELRQEISGIVAVEPEGDKISRFQAQAPLWEAGSVELPDPQVFDVPWLEDYIHDICTFPKAAHDDKADSTSQALIYIRNRMGGGIMDFYRKKAHTQQEADNVAQGKPAKPGARIPETILTRNVLKALAAGSAISCSPKQYPEIRQALLECSNGHAEAAKAEILRLDSELNFRG